MPFDKWMIAWSSGGRHPAHLGRRDHVVRSARCKRVASALGVRLPPGPLSERSSNPSHVGWFGVDRGGGQRRPAGRRWLDVDRGSELSPWQQFGPTINFGGRMVVGTISTSRSAARRWIARAAPVARCLPGRRRRLTRPADETQSLSVVRTNVRPCPCVDGRGCAQAHGRPRGRSAGFVQGAPMAWDDVLDAAFGSAGCRSCVGH